MLAAGAGRRFGPAGDKLLTLWRGRPVLGHVLDTLARARSSGLVADGLVVRPPDSDGIDRVCREAGFDSVVAEDATRGLAASLRAGFAALRGLPPADPVTAALILLGDQPAVPLAAIRAVVERGGGSRAALVRAAYTTERSAGHPVLVGRAFWDLADDLAGDRGFDPLLRARGLEWTVVDVAGANPDIDTASDLARLDGV